MKGHAMSSFSITSARGRLGAALAAVVLLLLVVAVATPTAGADPALKFTEFTAGAFDQNGNPDTRAGAHPWELRTTFAFEATADPSGLLNVPNAAVSDTTFELPPGVLGNPQAVPQCRQEQIEIPLGSCPATTQIGVAQIDLAYQMGRTTDQVPVYNMVPPPGQPAQFAFIVKVAVAHIDLTVRSDGNYGVTATVNNANAAVPVYGVKLHLWGVPADPSHDADRYLNSETYVGPFSIKLPRTPLLRNPTSCTGPVTTTVQATSWQEPDQVVTDTADSPAVTGCDQVPFDPSVRVSPSLSRAGTPSGFGVDVDLPQNENPDGRATADLRKAVVTLPPGVTVNPSSANGLVGCTDAQFGLHSTAAHQCPNASRLGSTTIDTPLLKKPVEGGIYLGQPLGQGPVASAAGDMLRLFVEGSGSGVRVKLEGRVVPDPVTGQLTATFDNNPQLPFSNFHLDFDGGPRAALSLPKACGTYKTHAELTSWASSTPVVSEHSFTIDQGCDQAGQFEPTLDAGLTNPVAGGSSPFTLTLSRPDGQQDLSGVTVQLPPGVLANVGSVTLCPEAQAATGTCSAHSQVGRVVVASGAGSDPLWVPQAGKAPTAVYLAGPYKGAPYSLSIVVPAQAGPYDLGTVVVRAALRVDPIDAHVTVESDPLPTILAGIPLSIQEINVLVDRPGFMVNPTNCDPKQVSAVVSGSGGATANLTNRFQVASCTRLAVDPKLALTLSGKGQTTDGKHPGIAAVLTQKLNRANLKKVVVTLPRSLALDPDNAQALCEFVDGSKVDPTCPKSSIVGSATAQTPILDEPLKGPVYFVKNVRIDAKSGRQIKTFPKLVIPLTGPNGLRLNLVGTSSVPDNVHLTTTFDQIPDAPVSKFSLNIDGGEHGILTVTGANVCGATQSATQEATGQNAKKASSTINLGLPCSLGVVSSSHTASALKVVVGGLGTGRVSVSGQGVKKSTRTISTATSATLTPPLTEATKSALAHQRDVTVRLTVSFTPKGAKQAKTNHKSVVIHATKATKKK
jgi:hypothetical protein